MPDLNEVRLIGRLTRDPILKSTSSGYQICNFGLATGRRYKDQDNRIKEETTFVEISCFGKMAENLSKYMRKGRLIYIGGRLKLDSWDDQNGQRHSRLSVIAENIQYLEKAEKAQGEAQEQTYDPNQNIGEPPF